MSAVNLIEQGVPANKTFVVRDAGKAPVDADVLPVVSNVQINGADSTLTTTITQLQDGTPANITGYYGLNFATGGLNIGDHVAVKIDATVGGVAVTEIVEFNILPATGTGRPCIDL